METTTMQKLIKELDKELKKYTLGGNQYYGLIHAKRLAETMLDLEKEQIIKAHIDGFDHIVVDFKKQEYAEQYYNETYKN